MSFVLSADSSGDILKSEMRARGIEYKPLIFTIDGVEHKDDFSDDKEYKAFYAEIRAGKLSSTSQINVAEHEEFFEYLVDKYSDDILYVTLSSGLSSSCASAKQAAETVTKKTGRNIYVVDSKGATIVTRHVIDEAERLRDAGASAEEAAKLLDDFQAHLHTWFMPTDLIHLKRGGRISGPAAYIGTALNIKPLIAFNELGGMDVVKKVHGIPKGISTMIEVFKEKSAKQPHKFYVASADSNFAAELFERARAARPDCYGEIGWIGPVIGSHTGCGAAGISFVSDELRK